MTDGTAVPDDRSDDVGPSFSVDGLRTYLRCPRRYEFTHVHDLEGAADVATGSGGPEAEATVERVALLRTAICDALEDGASDADADALAERVAARLASLWADHDERFHSRAQRRHERRMLEATVEAYAERFGADHAAGVRRLEEEFADGSRDHDRNANAHDSERHTETDAGSPFVGPDLRLSSSVRPARSTEGGPRSDLAGREEEPAPVEITASIDYVYADDASLVAVRFVPTLWSLGSLRYRSDWERVEDLFVDHFDPEANAFDPDPAAALLETAVVLDGLRNYRDRLGLSARTCRYVQIPLADRSDASINWVRDTVETTIDAADLTDVYVDHHTFGMTHEHRNETVDDRLESVVGEIRSGAFDPSERWDDIASDACPDCAYRVCCGDFLETEVGFDA
ncbi:PD-(D/E)XK nuclease family protein [Halobiforma nitratireducens]|uniref:PD-(D/E)XK endonuclease-like domain-containing protein n=1 Tax=Halobiforma nitratireducens JCM 10879 TaxID=1227454 RepID=M0M9G1_9EURY|nr:PD-(D/E)XK nuclease family protein [Halobiforma nitratireducens]EMA41015.1 hypothetical protein C446_06590 [Halobiforma nitratireducens JCM 10879]